MLHHIACPNTLKSTLFGSIPLIPWVDTKLLISSLLLNCLPTWSMITTKHSPEAVLWIDLPQPGGSLGSWNRGISGLASFVMFGPAAWSLGLKLEDRI